MAQNDSDNPLAIVDPVEVCRQLPPRLRLPLRTADDVQKELARLYRSMKAGGIAPADGTKLAYVLNLLRQAIETGQLEARLAALEAEANKVRGRY